MECEADELCEVVKRFAWLGEVQDAGDLVVSSICPGTNCIKMGLPGKLILSKRKGLLSAVP